MVRGLFFRFTGFSTRSGAEQVLQTASPEQNFGSGKMFAAALRPRAFFWSRSFIQDQGFGALVRPGMVEKPINRKNRSGTIITFSCHVVLGLPFDHLREHTPTAQRPCYGGVWLCNKFKIVAQTMYNKLDKYGPKPLCLRRGSSGRYLACVLYLGCALF